eukprot:jgi/Tetstr1/440885/TSEL_029157.t1
MPLAGTPAPAPAPAPEPAPAPSEPAAPPARFALTPADRTKLVEAIAALTGKGKQVVKENQSMKAQSYQGSKYHLNACGRPLSSPLHCANRAYGAQLDLLAATPTDDKARRWHELHGYQPQANPAQIYPDCHHMEAYHVNMLTWHWELLRVVDSPLFDASPDGERRVGTIVSVTGRIRFIQAVQKAREHDNGGPALSWPSVDAYRHRGHRTYLVSHELSLFGQWFSRLQAKQMDLLPEGVAPHLHDDLQLQLISAARGLLNTSWLHELCGKRGPPPGTEPSCPGPPQPEPRPVGPQGLRPLPSLATTRLASTRRTSRPPNSAPSDTDSTPLSSPLPALLLRKFGIDHALLAVRTGAAASVHIPAAYANLDGADCRLIYSTDGTAYQKLVLTQRAAGLGLPADPLAELLSFIDGLRAVRRSFKPSGSRKAANRCYLELGYHGDSAPPSLMWTIPPNYALGWAEWLFKLWEGSCAVAAVGRVVPLTQGPA